MKKKETVLLIENWRKFIKENSDEEDNNIFRSFKEPGSNNVLDTPDNPESSGKNFYASSISDKIELEDQISDPDLINFCDRMGIECNKKSLIEFLGMQAFDSDLDIDGKEIKRVVH